MTIEIVCQSPEDARIAEQCGAGRIELCVALELGGLTPSPGLLSAVKASVGIPVMAMVRSRPGHFVCSPEERAIMERDIRFLVDAGADGLVFGCLTETGGIDEPACRSLIDAASGRQTEFHRAFDCVADPYAALDTLVRLGVTRVLTSGLAPTAEAGAGTIAVLRKRAAGRIEVQPGGGIRAHNVRAIVEATGAEQVHLAPRRHVPHNDRFDFGEITITDDQMIRAVVAALHHR